MKLVVLTFKWCTLKLVSVFYENKKKELFISIFVNFTAILKQTQIQLYKSIKNNVLNQMKEDFNRIA